MKEMVADGKIKETDNIVIKMEGINKSFSGVKVLTNVNFTLRKGEIHGLVGKNGAGKSTLMKILLGVETKDDGTIELYGRRDIQNRYEFIAMIFQELSLIPTLTVAQNIFLTNPSKKGRVFLDIKEDYRRAREVLERLKPDIKVDELVENLSIADKQVVEIAKALGQEKKIMIMDEPTTSFTANQMEAFFNIIRKLKNEGISIVYISHNLSDIFKVCDRVTVLRDGKNVCTSAIKDTTMETVIEKMTGSSSKSSEVVKFSFKEYCEDEQPLLEVQNLSFNNKFKNISFKLYPGEILGIAGLTGSGKTELLEAIYGIQPIDEGNIYVRGERVSSLTPQNSLKLGISLVPDERQVKGLVLIHSVSDNIVLPIIKSMKKGFFTSKRKILDTVKNMIEKLMIKVADVNQDVMNLSGGNQQKVVIAKSFSVNSNIILMDDPTLGIDVESKREIADIIKNFVKSGDNAVILVSSELEVLEGYCDRVLIMKKGEIVGEIKNTMSDRITEDKLMSLIQ